MASEYKSWPIEIIDNILQHLPSNSLKECRKVCKLWCPYATRHFMNHVTLRSKKEIFRFLQCQPIMTNAVKKIKIPHDWVDNDETNEISKQTVQELMTLVPNLQELELKIQSLPLCHLKDVDLPENLKSVTATYDFKTYEESYNFLEIMLKFSDTIEKFNMINSEHLDKVDFITYFSYFPKLTELDMKDEYNVFCLTDYLPMIQAIPSLKTFCVYIGDEIDLDSSNTDQYKQVLSTLKKLILITPDIFPQTILFIIRNFVGLKEIGANFEDLTIGSSFDSDSLSEFLNFSYSLDNFDIYFNNSIEIFYQPCLTNILSNIYIQLPENSQNISRQLTIYLNDESDDQSKLKIVSYRDYCNRLQRKIMYSLNYKGTDINRLLTCMESSNKINVDIFTFNMTYISFVPDHIHLFLDLLAKVIVPKKVVLIISGNPNWSRYIPFKQLNHITELEIQVNVKSPTNRRISFSVDLFSNLKILHLVSWCGTWDARYKSYLLELLALNLESLHLDLTPLASNVGYFSNKNFMLVVKTGAIFHFYEISKTTLNTRKLSQPEAEKMQKDNYNKLYIKTQSLQNLHLTTSNYCKKTITLL